jgi:hypothetical protein
MSRGKTVGTPISLKTYPRYSTNWFSTVHDIKDQQFPVQHVQTKPFLTSEAGVRFFHAGCLTVCKLYLF